MTNQSVAIAQPKNSFPFMLVMSMAAHVIGLLFVLVAPYILPERDREVFGGPGGSGGNVITVDFGKGKQGPPATKPVTEQEPAPAKQIKKITDPDETEPESKLTLPEDKPNKKDEPTAKETLNQRERKTEGPFGKGTDTKKDAGKSGNTGSGQSGVGTIGIGEGTGGYGTGTGTPFPFPWYIENVITKIEQRWVKPYVLETTPQQYNCVVQFVITRAGQVRDVKVERGSGITALDRSAESAVLAAAPFPPLPNQWLEPDLSFRITFLYTP